MKKPFAYITAVWKGGEFTIVDQAAVYCRKVYEAGFTPICPVLYLPHFLRDSIPAEHKDGIDIGRELLRRSHCLQNLLFFALVYCIPLLPKRIVPFKKVHSCSALSGMILLT